MDDQIQTRSLLQRIKREKILLLFLLGLASFIVVARLHTYNEPLEHDITATAVIANEMRAGRSYYSDLWENKPPILYVVHLIAQIIFGYGPGYIYALNVILTLITLGGVYYAASVGRDRTAGFWAAAIWTVLSGDLGLQANQPNTEAFLNAPLIWALALLLRLRFSELNRRSQLLHLLAVGGCLTLASFYKPHSVFYGVLFGIALIVVPEKRTREPLIHTLKQISIIAGVGVIAWLLFFAYFALTGRFRIVYATMFLYPGYYSGDLLTNIRSSLEFSNLFPEVLRLITPLLLVLLFGGVTAIFKGPGRRWIFLIAYAIATQVTIGISGRFYNHYYQLWLPPLAVGVGWAVTSIAQIFKGQFVWVAHALPALALLFVLKSELWTYTLNPNQWAVKEYGSLYINGKRLAERLDDVLEPNESIYVFGDDPGFYFITRRRPVVGCFFLLNMSGGPLGQELTNQTVADLERHPPDMVIIMNNAIGPSTIPGTGVLGPEHPLRKWISDHYCPVTINNHAPFSLCARPGSDLQKRQEFEYLRAVLPEIVFKSGPNRSGKHSG